MISKPRHSIMSLVSTAGIVAAVLFGGAVSTAFAAASLTPLGDLPGGRFFSWASGVSGDGSVVVGWSDSANSSDFTSEAFRWKSGDGMVGLGDLLGGRFGSKALGVSANGSVVVGSSDIDFGWQHAFRWASGGGMVELGDLPGGGFTSDAIGVSADGSVIVGYGSSGSGDFEAFRWTSGGGMVGLGDLPGGMFFSGATDVSGDGAVIVGNGYSASGQEAFRWTSGGGMVGLGDLPGGMFSSYAGGVSADGSVVVGYGTSASGSEAFRWTSGDGMVGLGDLLGGQFSSGATGVSADGSVIVGYGTSASGEEAFRWTSGGGMRALWDVLLSRGVDPAADGWTTLTGALAISADGNTIVGSGIRNGNTEAFVAVIPTIVPEPAAGALALLGVISTPLLRRPSLWRPNKLKVLPIQGLAAVLTLAIILAPDAASAQEDDTLTISGTFSVGTLSGTIGPDLVEVFADGDDYTWTLTLHGTTQSHHYSFSLDTLWAFFDTEIQAMSFDLEFFGPDAATLNGIVSEHIAGGTTRITLSNIYTNGEDDFATMYVRVSGPHMALYSRQGLLGVNPLVPADADGYPVVGPESFSIWSDYTDLEDWRPGNDGRIISSQTTVTFEGSVGELPGDFNHDDKVDAADLLKWQGDFSQNANSDADKDGDSDGADFLAWQRQLGAGVPTVAASADVPEPAAGALALLGVSSILLLRRRSLGRPNKVSLSKDEPCDCPFLQLAPRGRRAS